MNVYLNLCRYKILQKECHYHFYLNFFDQNQNHNVLPKMKCFVHVTVINSPIYTRTSYHGRTKIYTGITPMLCSDTRTITQRLVRFYRTNLGRPLAIPHFCSHLKSIERSKLVCRLMNMSF